MLHQSPPKVILSIGNTIPLYCVVSNHSMDTVFNWKRGLRDQLVNTPVLWVNVAGIYSCSITSQGRVCQSAAFTVEWELAKSDISISGVFVWQS